MEKFQFFLVVSIHYMLLVQKMENLFQVQYLLFQYIICCWFKWLMQRIKENESCFNTLYVVGSICCYGRSKKRWYVSIHYMLLVQITLILYLILCIVCFNTLYVVGSRTRTYPTYNNQRVSIHYMLLVQFHQNLFPTIQSCFNTLYVVGSKISLKTL